MRHRLLAACFLTSVVLVPLTSRTAHAATIGFEGLISNSDASFTNLGISNTYFGYQWSASSSIGDWAAVDCASSTCFSDQALTGHTGTGYGWSSGGTQSLFIDFGGPVDVGGGWFAGLFSNRGGFNSSTIQLLGYDSANVLVASSVGLKLIDNQWQFLAANFVGVWRLELRSDRNFSWFAVDDLDVSPVPEPATLLLLGTGLGIAGVRRRLKRRV